MSTPSQIRNKARRESYKRWKDVPKKWGESAGRNLRMEKFKKELELLINKYSIEHFCDMPDFLMADMICGFIDIIGARIKKNLDWHGCDSVCHPKKESICDTAPYPKEKANEL